MTSFSKYSPVLPTHGWAKPLPEPLEKAYWAPDASLEVLKFANTVVDFLEGAQDYWSGKGLMEGYGEALTLATEYLGESLEEAHPLIQASLGSSSAAVKLMGVIPFGMAHWFHQGLRDGVDHGLWSGIETFFSIYAKGIINGADYVGSQFHRWSHGEISPTTFGAAEEVTTTLGTAVLMCFGLRAIYRGGSGMVQGLKNIELPSPALATATGQVLPVVSGAEAMTGGGPMVEGLIYMSGMKNVKNGDGPDPSSPGHSKPKQPLEMLVKEEMLPSDNPYFLVKSRHELEQYGFRISHRTKKFLIELESAPSNSKLALRFKVEDLLAGNAKYLRETHLEGLAQTVKSLRHRSELPKTLEPLNHHIATLHYALDHFPRSMRRALEDFNLSALQRAAVDFPQIGELLLRIEAFKTAK
jgi:hypothetical protein